MSTQLGPLDDDHERRDGFTDTLGGLAVHLTLSVLETISNDDPTVRYNIEKNRLSLHGERKHPGRSFDGGLLVMHLIFATCGYLLVGMWAVAEVAPMAAGTPLAPVSFTIFVLSFAVGLSALWGVVGRVKSLDVLDHTTQAVDDDRLDELASQFTNGDLTAAEHEQRVEQVLESEGRTHDQ